MPEQRLISFSRRAISFSSFPFSSSKSINASIATVNTAFSIVRDSTSSVFKSSLTVACAIRARMAVDSEFSATQPLSLCNEIVKSSLGFIEYSTLISRTV